MHYESKKQNEGTNSRRPKREDAIQKLIHLDKAYRFLTALNSYHPHFERGKKDLSAMTRKLHSATLFSSFSAAGTKWNHLLRMLGELSDHTIYSNHELNAL